jgi:hypothetical protein
MFKLIRKPMVIFYQTCHFALFKLMKCFICLKPIGHLDQGDQFLVQFDYMLNIIVNQIDHFNQVHYSKNTHVIQAMGL